MLSCFAVATPGLEGVTRAELLAGGWRLPDSGPVPGGVPFDADPDDLYRANLSLRTVRRVLVRLGDFVAASFPELRRKSANLPWEQYLAAGQPVRLRVTCTKSRLYHSGAVGERVAAAIGERLGGTAPPVAGGEDTDVQLVVVRLVRNRCTISLDSSGEGLRKHGYREATARAPLSEPLAAAMLGHVGWRGDTPLIDPFCGSGTIPIEGALLATGTITRRDYPFPFHRWSGFDARAWGAALAALPPPTDCAMPIIGSDRDGGAIAAARANAERAGMEGVIEWREAAVSAMDAPSGTGWIVTNPPYGVRVSRGADLRDLYAAFGRVVRERFAGWGVCLLCGDRDLLKQTGIGFDRGIPLDNGGLRVWLVTGRG